jgi:hypothetical protein
MEGTTETRTILYFPTIAVPNGTWLRRPLLYWDENPALVGWLAEAMGYGEKIPLDLGLTGLVAGGFLSVSQYWISQRNERRSTSREISYAYLYYGRAEKIIEPSQQ